MAYMTFDNLVNGHKRSIIGQVGLDSWMRKMNIRSCQMFILLVRLIIVEKIDLDLHPILESQVWHFPRIDTLAI